LTRTRPARTLSQTREERRMSEKILVQNVGQPGKTYSVDAAKYAGMRKAVLAVTPSDPPGLTPAQIIEAVKPHRSETLFPGGETAGWWVKCVQLDLEAKGILNRAPKAPVRLWQS
jgi:hypothetical protein